MAEMREGKLYVETPFGTLMAYSKGEPDNPGICIDLCRDGAVVDAPLILTEYTATEGDVEEGGHIISRVWGAATEEDYSERTVHTNIELFFADNDNHCQLQGNMGDN